jgi:hypothetical protein
VCRRQLLHCLSLNRLFRRFQWHWTCLGSSLKPCIQ